MALYRFGRCDSTYKAVWKHVSREMLLTVQATFLLSFVKSTVKYTPMLQ
jgi:hypothetical protein